MNKLIAFVEIVGLIAVVLVTGMFFYHHVEGWSYLDSLYFSVITVTTVGYGDLSPTVPISKIFTMVYLFIGVGIVFGSIMLLGERAQHKVTTITRRKEREGMPDTDETP
jgi:voltage-gated potassium channel